MRKTREILRLHFLGLKQRQIARSCSIAQSTVNACLQAAKAAGVTWPEVANWDYLKLESALFGELPSAVAREHVAGEKLWVDYAGGTVPIHESGTGEVRQASIFVAVLGCSSYTYAEATWSEELNNWIASHVRAFEHLRGLPAIVVPDNLRSGVTRANRYEPDLNPTYQEMAEHYGVAIIPARPYMTSERVIDMTSETMIDFVGIPINALRNSDKRAILVIIARSFATLLFARQRVSGWL